MFRVKFMFVINTLRICSILCSCSLTNSSFTNNKADEKEGREFNVEKNEMNHTLISTDKSQIVIHDSDYLGSENDSYLSQKIFIPLAVVSFDLTEIGKRRQNSTNSAEFYHDPLLDNRNKNKTKLVSQECENREKATAGYFAEAGNNTIIIKNGKKYRIMKFKKRYTLPASLDKNGKIKSQTFTDPTSHSSKQDGGETNDNLNFWLKMNTTKREKNFSNSGLESSDKIKKLLNLFTVVKFDNKECFVNGVKGVCLHQLECEQRGMKFASTCARDLGVCCYYGITCGEQSNQTSLYLSSDEFSDSFITPKICTFTISKSEPDVMQFRVDFLNFRLKGPTNGTCLHDRLVITGQSSNSAIPEICGVNTGQHLYIHVQDSDGPFYINFITMGGYSSRTFSLKVTQLKSGDDFASPKNCLQYFTEAVGNLQTFNYLNNHEISDESNTGYFNNLNYAICIKKLKGICSISYENEELDKINPTFQFLNMDSEGESLLPPLQAGAETFDCPDDYIIINGLRLCGEKLNDVSIEVDLTKNYPVTDTSGGPFIVFIRTDSAVNGRGLNIKYRQNQCPT